MESDPAAHAMEVEGEESRSAEMPDEGASENGHAEDGEGEGNVGGQNSKLPPKVDSDVLLVADGVTKQIMKQGSGETPGKYATCFVHYRVWSTKHMHKFNDTWEEEQAVEVVLGHEKKEQTGLALGIGSMQAGERAVLKVGYELGYGEQGNFSFPNVPPMSDLIYEVELIGFEAAREGVPRAQMTVEERIAAADRRKVDGNQFFKQEKVEAAVQQYEMALAYLGEDFMFQLEGKYKDMADSVKHPCHLNLAACYLKMSRFGDCIGQCTVVLMEDKSNVKALFRRGRAKAALGRTEDAKEDFDRARKLAPDDMSIVRELRNVAAQDKLMYEKQKEFYRGMFKAPVEKPQPTTWLALILTWLTALFRPLFRLLRTKTD